MDERISELLGMVRDEVEACEGILAQERRKTLALARRRAEELLECAKSGEERLARLHGLESGRSRLCGELGRELRIPEGELTLARLAESLAVRGADAETVRELRATAAALGDAVRRMGLASARNRRLMERMRQHADGMLAVLAGASGAYQPNGMFEAAVAVPPTFSQNA
ncbi:MAG: flagellar protein FlgN [Acidobacteriota bacterium]|jgi:hypothetical protein|nr:flagellar protein FlgN [Acidobacteriota bacterium]